MRVFVIAALGAVLCLSSLASAQSYVVNFEEANAEYGGSGSWVWSDDATGRKLSVATFAPRYGVPLCGPVTAEIEGMYTRSHKGAQATRILSPQAQSFPSETSHRLILGINALVNLSVSDRSSVFVLLGYGSTWWWGVQPNSIPEGVKNLGQYGFGWRFMLTANAAFRAEFRRQDQNGLGPNGGTLTEHKLLLGVSILE
ncbi:MAG: hypothetical protein QGH20_09600 [Candidatus Latescibacteria bacterium]|jgi:hypothetical protein|nr:hypothetical protein [Candidatus Latescibacterota bacterium]